MANTSVLSNGQSSERDFNVGLPEEGPKPDVARLAALARHLKFGRDVSDQSVGSTGKRSPQLGPIEPTLPGPPAPGSPGFKNDQVESDRTSFGTRIFRSAARFFIVALFGVGATLAWQSYGEEAKGLARTHAPSLAWLLPASAAKTAPHNQVISSAAQPLAADLAAVRRSVEQLAAQQAQVAAQQQQIAAQQDRTAGQQQQIAAQQERIAQSLATLQALEQEIKQKLSSPLPARTVTAPPRAAQSPAVQPAPAQPPVRQPLPLVAPTR